MPAFMFFLGLFPFSALAFPGTNSFVSEILVLIGAFKGNVWIGFAAVPGAMLAAAYMLRLLQRVTWGAPTSFKPSWWDLGVREWVTLAPLAVLVLYIGLAPSLAIKTMEPSIERVLATMKSKNMAMALEDRHLAQRLHLPALTVADGRDQIKKERP